ncbi:penicillin-binding protein [Candidatus Saccharibacteria bacterium]|nr:penicillin-binding protein [Candidatus Saccharibacteria bacterium]
MGKRRSKVRADGTSRESRFKLPDWAWLKWLDKHWPNFLRWSNIKAFWFSKRGLFFILKTAAITLAVLFFTVLGLFLYFRRDIAHISPEAMRARIANSTNRYYDRNDVLLWEDRGEGNYRMLAEGDQISQYVRWAIVAIEDRDFYAHRGISIRGTIRAVWMTVTGRSVQGGSTLTQQLVKQVFLAEEAHDRGITGIPRKIREVILAIEVERIYDKEDIITMYLNESPFGGRRNGIQSGARAYFGRDAIDLTLAEAAMLASIPQNPSRFDPFNTAFNSGLIWRQNHTLDVMAELGFISREDAEANKIRTISFCEQAEGCTNPAQLEDGVIRIRPREGQFTDARAPHFVTTVRQQLENEFGVAAIRAGGWRIKTTLDIRAQEAAEAALSAANVLLARTTANNIAMASVDVETGQVIAIIGSTGFDAPVFGQLDATTRLLEPGSSIKQLVDYAPLFMERPGVNWAPGSILRDEDINAQYCAGDFTGRCSISNVANITGNLAIRTSLATSLNRPAVKALMINGAAEGVRINRELGNWSYCANGETFWSLAIGSGCGVRIVEHANAHASLARGGAYQPLTYVLQVIDPTGREVQRWEPSPSNQVVDPQVAYLIGDILSDPNARRPLIGGMTTQFGWTVPGVWTASKTGTTTTGTGQRKDNWFVSYSPVVSTAAWCGNHDGSGMNGCGDAVRRLAHDYMLAVHRDVYIPEGRYTTNQGPERPRGIHSMSIGGNTDIFPSWMNQGNTGFASVDVAFNQYTGRRASTCTPPSAIVTFNLPHMVDPVTGTDVFLNVPEGFTYEEDDVETCIITPGGIPGDGYADLSSRPPNSSIPPIIQPPPIVTPPTTGGGGHPPVPPITF